MKLVRRREPRLRLSSLYPTSLIKLMLLFRFHKEIPKLRCPHCPHEAFLFDKKRLQRHIEEIHTMGRIYPCPEFGCQQTFRRVRNLKQHSFIHLNIKPYQCKWCDYTGTNACMPSLVVGTLDLTMLLSNVVTFIRFQTARVCLFCYDYASFIL